MTAFDSEISPPNHLAIIMDGSRRWAERMSVQAVEGQKRGAKVANDIVIFCRELSIPILTLYSWSIDNWKLRSKDEFEQFINLLNFYLDEKRTLCLDYEIRLKFIGVLEIIPQATLKRITEIERATAHNSKLILNLAVGYGGRQEIVSAFNAMIAAGVNEISEDKVCDFMYTKGLPDPDFLIRTGGEQRISNFLLWQSAYTELYFCDTLWPDFSRACLLEALREYSLRVRRYGR